MMKKWCLVFLAVTLCLVSASALSGGVDEYPSAYPVPALTGNYVKDFISVARSQVGYTASSDNTSEYWVWAGSKGTTHAWCSEFVSWCAAKANIPETIVPLARSSAKFRTFFSDQGRFYSFAYGCTSSTCGCVGLASGTLSAADLQPGDILLIDTDGQIDNGPDHTELVAKVQGSVITTIDGNVGGKRNADGTKGFAEVREEPLDLERYPVHGVCRPNYTGLADGVAINEITFPDPAFREHVKSYIDWNGNLRLDADELAKVTIINVDTEYLSAPLYSLQGIEYFTALEELYCSANNLTELDLSGNTKLRVLYCWNNSISSVNLSGNSSLEQLIITNNQLTELDVSSCQNLKKLICSYNPLTSLKLGNNALQELECGTTNITELDIRRCPLLVNMVVNTDPTFYGGERPPLEWLLGNCRLLVDHGIRVVYNDQGIFYCHDPKKHDRVDSTAENTGTEEYWQCYVCNTLFSDADGKNPIDEPPVIPVKKYTGAEFTSNEGLAAKLDLLFTGQVAIFSNTNFGYPIGSRLNNNMLYKWNNNRYGGYQCYAYANAAYNYLFGEDPGPDNSNYSKSKLIPGVKGLSGLTYEILSGAGVGCGAYIRTTANPNGDFDPSNAHSMIVLGYGKKGITILHGNADTNGLVTVSENSWDFFNNNLFTGKNHRVCYVLQPNATLRIPNPTPDPEPKPDQPVAQSAMSKAEFDAAALNSQVCIDAYVQAAQGWYNRDGTGRIALYLQSGEDGYFAYDVLAGQAESAKLVPGTKIRLKGVKTEWAGEVEIIDGTYEILEASPWIAAAEDVTALLGTDGLVSHMNRKIAIKGAEVVAYSADGAAFAYGWDNSGSHNANSDLYFKIRAGGKECTVTVESALCGNNTDVYRAVEGVKTGDRINLEGFLYWYNGANPHITKVTNLSADGTGDKVEGFVSRCYKLILGRDPDDGGLNGWCDALKSRTAAAANIIDGFVRSDEFTNRKLSAGDSVDILYRTMLDRAADAGGKAGWTDALNQGYTLQNIIDGFCGSDEFTALCKDFGIEPGSIGASAPTAADTPRGKIEAFVKRCYKLILNRDADQGGLKGWSDALETGAGQACQIIDGFVRSPEYVNRNLGYAESVDILYQTMLNRAADAGGKAGWVDALEKGYTLQHIINGFCGSAEFTNICNEFGITAGNLLVQGVIVKREAITPEGEEEAPVVYVNYTSEYTNGEKVRAFVEHCYEAAFGRKGDAEGIEAYTQLILEGKKTPKRVVYEFVFSSEFQNQLPGNEAFIRILYKLYFGREANADEVAGWAAVLENGTSLEEVVNGFASSAEFKAVMDGMKE